MSINLQKLNLRKEQVFNLKKNIGIENQKAKVVIALDYSGSMGGLYSNGTVQDTLERLLPIAMSFDDDNEADFYIFEDGVTKLPENITIYNLNNYVSSKILGKYQMGGTNYSPCIKTITEDFGNPSPGWFGKSSSAEIPTYVIFITDGENNDRNNAEKAIKEASKHGIFFQFVGIGNSRFDFLEKLDNMSGRLIDNANFFKISDLNKTSDENLYSLLLKEFPSWLKLARNHSLIK